MDKYTPSERSILMSKIRSKNTTPEIVVRSLLHSLGFRFRLHRRDLPGIPDIVLPKYKTVILIQGCFWHCHQGCKDAGIPKTNTDFWKNKLEKNRERDQKNIKSLKEIGWRVIEIWECEIKDIEILKVRLAGYFPHLALSEKFK